MAAAGLVLLAGQPTAHIWPEPSGEWKAPLQYLSQLSVSKVRSDLSTGVWTHTDWEKAMQSFQRSENPLEQMDLLLALYEADRSYFQGVGTDNLFPQIPSLLGREMLAHFFNRWQQTARQATGLRTDFVYQIQDWQSILLPIIQDALAAQFVRIQLEGFSLWKVAWFPLWERVAVIQKDEKLLARLQKEG